MLKVNPFCKSVPRISLQTWLLKTCDKDLWLGIYHGHTVYQLKGKMNNARNCEPGLEKPKVKTCNH